MQPSRSLLERSVSSVVWRSGASLFGALISFGRLVVLARLLPVDTFGYYALARSIVGITVFIPNFGMAAAFLHRSAETEDIEQASRVHFTLKLVFTLIWLSLLLTAATVFISGPSRLAIVVVASTTAIVEIFHTSKLVYVRRVEHRRLAAMSMANTVASALIPVLLALAGMDLAALLSSDIVTAVLNVSLLVLWRPVWRPRMGWSKQIVKYFLSFGYKSFFASGLYKALDRVDDLWTGFFLGATALGYYSRAYRIATFPRGLLASPLNTIAGGTYAELKFDRRKLSIAFFRTNAVLVRAGFLLAGLMTIAAGEFVELVLGPKWLPIVITVQLMLVFTMFDPIKITVSNLFSAVGMPELIVRARILQLVALSAGIFAFGPLWGIRGVAIAVDIMLLAGIAALLIQAKRFVDFSTSVMFGPPLLAFTISFSLPVLIFEAFDTSLPLVVLGVVKSVAFLVPFITLLYILEHRHVSVVSDLIPPEYRRRYKRLKASFEPKSRME